MMQRIASAAFKLERRSVEPLFVLRCSLGVGIAILAGYSSGHPIDAIAAAIGAVSTGFGSLQGVYRTRAATMIGMSFAMAFSTIVAMLVGRVPALALVALALWGLGYGLL